MHTGARAVRGACRARAGGACRRVLCVIDGAAAGHERGSWAQPGQGWAAALMPTGMGGRGQGGGKADLGLCTPAEQAVARLAGRHGGLHVGAGRGGARGLEHDLLLDDLEHDELRLPPAELAHLGRRRRLEREGEPGGLHLGRASAWA